MDPEIKAHSNAIIAGILGFVFSFSSPIRDPIANYAIVLGFLLTSIILISNLLFRVFRIFRRTHPIYFTIRILNIILTVIIIIGILFGRIVGTWSPFWFLPFGYYIFLSANVIYIGIYDMKQLYILYEQTQLGRRVTEETIALTASISQVASNEICDCGKSVSYSYLFCPFCGRVLRKEE